MNQGGGERSLEFIPRLSRQATAQRITLVMAIITGAFLICNIPFFVLIITGVHPADDEDEVEDLLIGCGLLSASPRNLYFFLLGSWFS